MHFFLLYQRSHLQSHSDMKSLVTLETTQRQFWQNSQDIFNQNASLCWIQSDNFHVLEQRIITQRKKTKASQHSIQILVYMGVVKLWCNRNLLKTKAFLYYFVYYRLHR